MDVTALFSHPSADSIVAYRGGRALRAAQFLDDARLLADSLPPGRHVLNACADRYRFAVGLAASLITGRVSLLPSTHTPEVIRHLLQFAPDTFCLTDDEACTIDLPRVRLLGCHGVARFGRSARAQRSMYRKSRTTSSLRSYSRPDRPAPRSHTGKLGVGWPAASTPKPASSRLPTAAPFTLIGTVPPQHMYGFESTVLVALQSANAFTAERPFYPADIAAAITEAPRPRALITTPVHLRTLLASGIAWPALDLVVSATAPLSRELAHEAESRSRRSAAGDLWINRNWSDRDSANWRIGCFPPVPRRETPRG